MVPPGSGLFTLDHFPPLRCRTSGAKEGFSFPVVPTAPAPPVVALTALSTASSDVEVGLANCTQFDPSQWRMKALFAPVASVE
jgi:hypothetical protein